MKFDIQEFEKRVELGLIRRVENGDLVLYNYTDKCTYEKAWDEYTRAARGIIFDKTTGAIVARPFPKFFNLGEMPETEVKNLPDSPYQVTEKMDGSLGIIYHHNNEWHVATRGSFNSEQAVKATEMLKKYDIDLFFPGLTYLVEIIYPDNKIVVNYGTEEKLVLLGAWIVAHDIEVQHIEAFDGLIPVAKRYQHTIEQMIALQKTMPKDQEGFVVRYDNGLRVKIKGEEYLRIHKMISCMSPLSFWESMKEGVVNREYVAQLPEEFRNEFEPMIEALESQYQAVICEIAWDGLQLPVCLTKELTKEDLKTVGLFIQSETHGLKHASAMFPFLLKKKDGLEKYVMKVIRPDANCLKSF